MVPQGTELDLYCAPIIQKGNMFAASVAGFILERKHQLPRVSVFNVQFWFAKKSQGEKESSDSVKNSLQCSICASPFSSS